MTVKIIPFQITREEAEYAIRKELRKGFFVPRAVKRFQAESVRAVYVPFCLYDISYRDRPTIWAKPGKHSYTFQASARTVFQNLPVSASEKLPEKYAKSLEPYDMTALVDVKEGEPEGFYTDDVSLDQEKMQECAFARCKKMFDAELLRHISDSRARIEHSHPQRKLLKQKDVLLPVWFVTLYDRGMPYTLLVNGQTGKVVGTVPYRRMKVAAVFLLLLGLLLTFVPRLCCKWLAAAVEKGYSGLFLLLVLLLGVCALLFFVGYCLHGGVKEDMEHAANQKTAKWNQEEKL